MCLPPWDTRGNVPLQCWYSSCSLFQECILLEKQFSWRCSYSLLDFGLLVFCLSPILDWETPLARRAVLIYFLMPFLGYNFVVNTYMSIYIFKFKFKFTSSVSESNSNSLPLFWNLVWDLGRNRVHPIVGAKKCLFSSLQFEFRLVISVVIVSCWRIGMRWAT